MPARLVKPPSTPHIMPFDPKGCKYISVSLGSPLRPMKLQKLPLLFMSISVWGLFFTIITRIKTQNEGSNSFHLRTVALGGQCQAYAQELA